MPAAASRSAISFKVSSRGGTSGLLPSRSVGPLPEISTTPGTRWISLTSGSRSVPASVVPAAPAKRTSRLLVPEAYHLTGCAAGAPEAHLHLGRRRGGEVDEGDILALRDHQDVNCGFRVDVVEGEREV